MTLLSIATPTHDPRWLLDAYHSLRWQSYKNWEWVILPNHTDAGGIPQEIRDDARVRIVPVNAADRNVGALKRLAFDNCLGSAVIELDHDDFLMPGGSLQAIADAFAAGAGFVFSDDCVVREDRTSLTYNHSHGFQDYEVRLYGRSLKATSAFNPVTPRSLCEVYYAPDHVRAWSREAYTAAGGHDPALKVGDDHDLICRTYLAGAPFKHTGGCHYVYRTHATNTFKLFNDEIQVQSRLNRERYLGPLIREWCRRHNLSTLDISQLCTEGWQWERDLPNGFGEEQFGVISCLDQLQFCPARMVPTFMEHCYDALLPGGYLEISVPSARSDAGFMFHQAQSWHTAASFLPYTQRAMAKIVRDVHCRFQHIQAFTYAKDKFHEDHDLRYIMVHLAALKGQRQPGLCLI